MAATSTTTALARVPQRQSARARFAARRSAPIIVQSVPVPTPRAAPRPQQRRTRKKTQFATTRNAPARTYAFLSKKRRRLPQKYRQALDGVLAGVVCAGAAEVLTLAQIRTSVQVGIFAGLTVFLLVIGQPAAAVGAAGVFAYEAFSWLYEIYKTRRDARAGVRPAVPPAGAN